MAAQNPSLNTKVFHSMRDWIAYLEQTKRLVRAKKGVPLKYTLAVMAKQLTEIKRFYFLIQIIIPFQSFQGSFPKENG